MINKKNTAKKVVNLERSERSDQNGSSRPARKGIYLLPNLLTTGALFGGFYAVLSGFSGQYEWAAMAIFAALMDLMGG